MSIDWSPITAPLRAHTPTGSAWHGLAALIEAGGLSLGAAGAEPPVLVAHEGRVTLHPHGDDLVASVVYAAARQLMGPALPTRHAFAQGRVRAFASGLQATPVPDDLDALAARALARRPRTDPDRAELATVLAALAAWAPTPDRALSTPTRLRAWVRARVEHHGATAEALTDHLHALTAAGALDPALLDEEGAWAPGSQPVWVPHARVPDATTDAAALMRHLQALPASSVVGFAGAAASGKTTLATQAEAALTAQGRRVRRVHADRCCWPGEGFRYRTEATGARTTWLYGPGIYDDARIAAEARPRGDDDLVLVDGVFLGLDPEHDPYDQIVLVTTDEPTRLARKWQRDHVGGHRRIDVRTDHVHKVFHEVGDWVDLLEARADLIVRT